MSSRVAKKNCFFVEKKKRRAPRSLAGESQRFYPPLTLCFQWVTEAAIAARGLAAVAGSAQRLPVSRVPEQHRIAMMCHFMVDVGSDDLAVSVEPIRVNAVRVLDQVGRPGHLPLRGVAAPMAVGSSGGVLALLLLVPGTAGARAGERVAARGGADTGRGLWHYRFDKPSLWQQQAQPSCWQPTK